MISALICVAILGIAYFRYYQPNRKLLDTMTAKVADLQKTVALYDAGVMSLAQRQKWENDVRAAIAALTPRKT